MKERERRLNQMLRVAKNRMRRFATSRRGSHFLPDGSTCKAWTPGRLFPSDFHLEVRRLLGLLGRQDEADAMEAVRKEGYV